MLRRLTLEEHRAFDHVSERTRQRARLVAVPWLPHTFAGLTLGPLVLLDRAQPTDGSSTLIAHELVHVEQWQRHGPLRFLVWYLGDFVRQYRTRRSWMESYRAIDAEVEARRRTRRWWDEQRQPPTR